MATVPGIDLPTRRSVRHPAHDYGGGGWYHVTLVTARRRALFGRQVGESVERSAVGQVVERLWRSLPARMPHVDVDEMVVMPDHLHGILRLRPLAVHAGPARLGLRTFGGSQAGELSLVVNLFKGDVTREARRILGNPSVKVWHRGYHERIIRSRAQLRATRIYIRMNPRRR